MLTEMLVALSYVQGLFFHFCAAVETSVTQRQSKMGLLPVNVLNELLVCPQEYKLSSVMMFYKTLLALCPICK